MKRPWQKTLEREGEWNAEREVAEREVSGMRAKSVAHSHRLTTKAVVRRCDKVSRFRLLQKTLKNVLNAK